MARTRESTYSGILGDWQRLLAPVAANGEELAHLAVPRAQLEELLARVVRINQEQAARTAAKQEASQQLQTLLPEGQRLATLLRVGIKQHFGIRSEKLAEFGLQPFRGRKSKRTAPDGEAPAPQPAPTPTPFPAAADEATDGPQQ